MFDELERSALKPLPAEPYVFAEWKECRVGLDYHVEIKKHYYSVPHQLLREKVWARITARTVEVFHRGKRVPAAEIESAVVDQLRGLLRAPEIIVRTWRAAKSMGDISEAAVREALARLDPLWDELFPAEQARIVQLLVERVDVSPDGADIRLRTEGLTTLVADLRAVRPERRAA